MATFARSSLSMSECYPAKIPISEIYAMTGMRRAPVGSWLICILTGVAAAIPFVV